MMVGFEAQQNPGNTPPGQVPTFKTSRFSSTLLPMTSSSPVGKRSQEPRPLHTHLYIPKLSKRVPGYLCSSDALCGPSQGPAKERAGTGRTGGDYERVGRWLKLVSINTSAGEASGKCRCQRTDLAGKGGCARVCGCSPHPWNEGCCHTLCA